MGFVVFGGIFVYRVIVGCHRVPPPLSDKKEFWADTFQGYAKARYELLISVKIVSATNHQNGQDECRKPAEDGTRCTPKGPDCVLA